MGNTKRLAKAKAHLAVIIKQADDWNNGNISFKNSADSIVNADKLFGVVKNEAQAALDKLNALYLLGVGDDANLPDETFIEADEVVAPLDTASADAVAAAMIRNEVRDDGEFSANEVYVPALMD